MTTEKTDLSQLFDDGLSAHRHGDIKKAEALYEAVLKVAPEHTNALHLLGVTALQTGREERGLALIEKAVALKPDFAEALVNLGNGLFAAQRFKDALRRYSEALRINSGLIEAKRGKGKALKKLGRFDEALTEFDAALSLDPGHAETHAFRGNVLHEMKRFHDARESYDRALALAPHWAEFFFNRGNSWREEFRFKEAVSDYTRAIELAPDYPEAFFNRGNALEELNRLEEARADFESALKLRPDYGDAHFNLGLNLLKRGHFKEGWAEYEWRKKRTVPIAARSFDRPLWRGEDLKGKTLFVYAEQGFGDTIQFCRYLPLIEALGATVIFAAPKALHRLLNAWAIIDEDRVPENFDYHAPLLSLPGILGTTEATIPASTPYLTAKASIADIFHTTGRNLDLLRVGIAWTGRPTFIRNAHRSIRFEQLAPLWTRQDIAWISLQRDVPACDAPALATSAVEDISQSLTDFAATAAVIATLDLVITVDTAVAHLTGALGKPVWILLPFSSDWRWLTDRTDSPWYPSAQLFRQEKPGDWTGVFQQVNERLSQIGKLFRRSKSQF